MNIVRGLAVCLLILMAFGHLTLAAIVLVLILVISAAVASNARSDVEMDARVEATKARLADEKEKDV